MMPWDIYPPEPPVNVPDTSVDEGTRDEVRKLKKQLQNVSVVLYVAVGLLSVFFAAWTVKNIFR